MLSAKSVAASFMSLINNNLNSELSPDKKNFGNHDISAGLKHSCKRCLVETHKFTILNAYIKHLPVFFFLVDLEDLVLAYRGVPSGSQ